MYVTAQIYHTKWIVYLDPDAQVISRLITDKMLQYGLNGNTILSDKKPYENTDEELEDLANDIL